jgi:Zn-dependent protease
MARVRGEGIDLFRLSGVTVAIDYSWLVIFALVLWGLSAGYFPDQYPGFDGSSYWMVGLIASLLFFASVLIHELSHAWVANRLGERVSRITLFIFGWMAICRVSLKPPPSSSRLPASDRSPAWFSARCSGAFIRLSLLPPL